MPVEPCFIEGASNADLDREITPELISDLYSYAKENFINKGIGFPDAIKQMSDEMKISQRQLSYILNKPKAVRVVAADVAKLQKDRARFLADNRRYLNDASRTDLAKLAGLATTVVRGTTLAIHGPVIGAIHPVDYLFTPGEQGKYIRMYARGIGALSRTQMDAIMTDLAGKADYQMWQDMGLPIGPHDQMLGFKLESWSGRAMEAALKPLMWEKAVDLRNNVAPEWRDDKTVLKDIAQQSANSVGAVAKGQMGHGPFTDLVNSLSLAAQLNFSRWWKTVVDPAKTLGTYSQAAIHTASKLLPDTDIGGVSLRRPPPTSEARIAASNRMWAAGKFMGGIVSALVLNDQLSRWLGSKARVNFTDPSRSDYFAFRVKIPGIGDYAIKTRGSMEVLQLLARAFSASNPYTHQKFGAKTPEEVMGRYTEYKATPSISLGKETLTGRDVFGRPVPWSNDPGTRFAPRYSSIYTGQNRLLRGITSPEYIGQHAPIFIGHGVQSFYEGLRESGIDGTSINAIFRGLQQHPEILARAGFEGASEFLGINPQRERGKPYVVPQAQQKFEQNYLPPPRQ